MEKLILSVSIHWRSGSRIMSHIIKKARKVDDDYQMGGELWKHVEDVFPDPDDTDWRKTNKPVVTKYLQWLLRILPLVLSSSFIATLHAMRCNVERACKNTTSTSQISVPCLMHWRGRYHTIELSRYIQTKSRVDNPRSFLMTKVSSFCNSKCFKCALRRVAASIPTNSLNAETIASSALLFKFKCPPLLPLLPPEMTVSTTFSGNGGVGLKSDNGRGLISGGKCILWWGG